MCPANLIRLKLLNSHRGMANAIPRQYLFKWLADLGWRISDRELRKIVKGIPRTLSWKGGYFIEAKSKEEVKVACESLKKKIYGLAKETKRIRNDYPEFYQGEQLELFDEIEERLG